MGYTKTAIAGVSWLTAFRIVTRIVSLGKTAVVARFLSPAQFGLFGVATILLSFIEVVTETGVNIILVQQKDSIDKYLPMAWLISIIRGILIAGIMVISSSGIANFFHAPEAIQLIIVMSLVPFIRGFINPAVVKLQKELLFKREFIYRSTILFIEVAFTVVLLFLYPQPISLIWGLVVGAFVEMAFSFFVVSSRPSFTINTQYLKMLLQQGKWITGGVIFNYGFEKGDDIVVGRFLGTQTLGIYDMAYRFSLLPISEIASVVIRVVFPVFVKISDDYTRLKRAYFRTMVLVFAVVTPFSLMLYIFTDPIILLILGEKWLLAAPVLKVLAIVGAIRSISTSASSILMALGKQKQLTLTAFISCLGLFVTLIPFVTSLGMIGAAYSAILGFSISIPVTIYFSWVSLQEVKHANHQVPKTTHSDTIKL